MQGYAEHLRSIRPAHLLINALLPAAVILFITPFVVLLFYSLPATDDFCKATLSFGQAPRPQPSIFAVTWLYYTQWSPRWLTTLLQSSIMSHLNLVSAYGWLLLVIVITNVAALWFFFQTILELPNLKALLAAGVFYAAFIATLSDVPQLLYWLTGAIEYSLSFSSLLVLVSLLCGEYRSLTAYVSIGLLSIAIPAQHEIAGTLLCAVLVGGIVLRRLAGRSSRDWILSIGLASISLGIVLLSPGNAARAAIEHRHLWDFRHFPHWAAHSFYHGADWLLAVPIILAGITIALLKNGGPSIHSRALPPWLETSAIAAMGLLLGEVVLIEVARGEWLPYRVSAWFQFFFWLAFVCTIVATPEIYRIQFSQKTKLACYLLLVISLLGSSNFRAAVEDLRGPAPYWWKTGSLRYEHRFQGPVTFEGPFSYPKLTFHQNLSQDPSCFVNECLATYLGASTVSVKNSDEECPH